MTIDAQLAALLGVLPATDIGGAATDPVSIRAGMAQVMAQLPVTVPVADVHDADADGVPVRVYRPASGGPLPLVLFAHGGGFVIGSVDTHDGLARRLARDAEVVVVSVDYRLAPEHPFPAAVDDCWTALRWSVAHARELGADPSRVAVAGDSAGGNLAAVLTHLAREAGGPALTFQLLLYPVTGGHQDWPSVDENAEAPILTRRALEWFTAQYGADGSVRSAPDGQDLHRSTGGVRGDGRRGPVARRRRGLRGPAQPGRRGGAAGAVRDVGPRLRGVRRSGARLHRCGGRDRGGVASGAAPPPWRGWCH